MSASASFDGFEEPLSAPAPLPQPAGGPKIATKRLI